jgi:hypothetical protein
MPVNEPASHYTIGPSIDFDSSGNPWAVWYGDDPLTIFYSRWNGSAWEPEREVIPEDSVSDHRPWILGDYNGQPWVAWSKNQHDTGGAFLADIVYSRWNGTDWDSMQYITHSIRDDYHPILDAGGGELWVVWYGDTFGGPNPVDYNIFASHWNGTNWGPEILVSHPDTGYEWGLEHEGNLAVDAAGHPHVVWNTYWDGCVFYRTYNGNHWLDPVAIVDTSEALFGAYPYITIDTCGNRHVVFVGPDYTIYYSKSSDGLKWSEPYLIWGDDYLSI